MLLLAADGVANEHIARQVGVSPKTVRAWRARFAEEGLAKLGKVRPGEHAIVLCLDEKPSVQALDRT